MLYNLIKEDNNNFKVNLINIWRLARKQDTRWLGFISCLLLLKRIHCCQKTK